MQKRICNLARLLFILTIFVSSIILGQSPPTTNAASNITQTSFTANWTPTTAAPAYYMMIATDAGFVNIVGGYNNFNVGNGTSYNVTGGLTANTLYYYKIGVSAMVAPYVYSAAVSFRTGPQNPVATAATGITTNAAQGNWNSVSNASSYEITIASNSSFTTDAAAYSSEVLSYSFSGLAPNTPYWYKVRAYNSDGGVSGYSNVISFTTTPNPPGTPIVSAATSITQNVFSANWGSVSNADGYYLDVSTSTDFPSFVTGFNGKDVGNVTAYQVTGLTANTIYFYRIRAYNTGGTSSNSNAVRVTTLPNAPPAPVQLTPTNISQTGFTANWNLSAGAAKYYLFVATDNAFTYIVNGYSDYDVGNVTTYAVSGLSANTTYYCKIHAANTGGLSTGSNVTIITTLPYAPTAPVATAASLITQTGFTANWNPVSGAVGYNLNVSSDNSFSTNSFDYSIIGGGSVNSFAVTGLNANTTYYYRLRAYNPGGTSGYSNVIALTTLLNIPPAHVALPAALLSNSSFSARWNASEGAAGYYLDVAADAAFSSFLSGYNNKDVGNVTAFTLTGINYNTNYYYRVRAYNSGGTSANSNLINVYISVGIESSTVPNNYFLYQNYPNPFNPSTIIKFNLKKSSLVKIILYNITGRELDLLTNREYQRGMNQIRFDAANLANGIYLYRIISNEFSDIKKMILLK